MPFNVTSPNSLVVGAEFISSGVTYTPSSASMAFLYYTNGSAVTDTYDLTLTAGRWTVTWPSLGVDVPSDVNWTIYSSCYSGPVEACVIRVIDP